MVARGSSNKRHAWLIVGESPWELYGIVAFEYLNVGNKST